MTGELAETGEHGGEVIYKKKEGKEESKRRGERMERMVERNHGGF